MVTSSAAGPSLLAPTVAVRMSFLAAMSQFQAEGRGEPGDDSVLGQQPVLGRRRADIQG